MSDHPAVKLWRDQYRLNLSQSWKADVAKTVTDLELWKSVLALWKKEKRHPGIKGILDEYDRRHFDEIQQKGSGVHSEESLPERAERRMPEYELPTFLERTRL